MKSRFMMMVPDDNLTNENRNLSVNTTQHIEKYPFAHSEREVNEYFLRHHSSFVLREVRLYFEDIDCIFCSLDCASHFNRVVLQTYTQSENYELRQHSQKAQYCDCTGSQQLAGPYRYSTGHSFIQ
ncbi:Uncharacterized protein FWK35_00035893 [Aphis craccivora]|uniref:Uncharacterized protein n=1 Tax=Aphis craccivora TaxID=307492 RepID=A0A6G0VWR5_APHCR|nr:Uncharacterized protein FWK35_00035893 [Aphis craccivora]